MPETILHCQCGARSRFPEWAGGRTAKCPKCGTESVLPRVDRLAPAPEPATGSPPSTPVVPPEVVIEASDDKPMLQPPVTSFWSDVAYSFFFIIEPASLASLAVVWFLNCLLIGTLHTVAVGPVIFILLPLAFAAFAAFAFLFAYYMHIITETAAGEEELPSTVMMGSLYEYLLRPWFVFVATWACLLVPALAIALVRTVWILNIPDELITVAVYIGVFMWPMAILCVSMGGVSVFVRADLMVVSVLRTLGPYLFVWLLLLATVMGGHYVWQLVQTRPGPGGVSYMTLHPFAGLVLWSLILAYGSVVVMRVIGLYYRHFRHRFAWSWE